MTSTGPERLDLPDPAGRLWTYIRNELRYEIEKRIPDFKGWSLTGGTILAAQWGHRESTDIDLKVPPQTGLAALGPRYDKSFNEAMERLGAGTPVHSDKQIVIPLFDAKVDIFEGVPTPTAGQREATIDEHRETVLSNTQILSGKLTGRGLESPTRDLFDVAVAGELDPDALEAAVNCIPEDTWRETIARWRETAPYHADQADLVLKNVAERWVAFAADPATAAVEKGMLARYEDLTIVRRDGALEVTTRCRAAEPRIRRIDNASPEAMVEDLNRQGVHEYLEHATGRADAILESIQNGTREDRVIYTASGNDGTPAGSSLAPGGARLHRRRRG